MPRTKEQFEKIREETRAKILNSALEVFSKKGYSNTSISDIAESAQISKGLIYNYFESKQKLIEDVVQLLFIEIGNMLVIIGFIKDPYKKLHKIIDLTLDWVTGNADFWRLYATLLMQEETKTIVENVASKFMEELFLELEKIFSKIKIDNPSAEARIFGAILDGISFHILFMGNHYPIEETRQFLKEKYSTAGMGN